MNKHENVNVDRWNMASIAYSLALNNVIYIIGYYIVYYCLNGLFHRFWYISILYSIGNI